MEKILIAGGTGFIGSNLTNHLLETTNYKITVIDNNSTGSLINLNKNMSNKNLSIIQDDITMINPSDFTDINIVYHLASRASPIDFTKYPVEILKTNSLGTQNLLEISKNNNAKFILASTSEIYGDPAIHPQPETYFGNVNSVGERSPYNEGKRYAEAITMAYHRKYNLDIIIFRIFNTYGPNMRFNDERVIPNFINQAINKVPLTIKGSGFQTRSFCYVDDLIQGLVLPLKQHNLIGKVINLGNNDEISILDLATKICEIFNIEIKIEYLPEMNDEPKRRKPDLSLINSLCGWKPSTSIKEGLIKTISHLSNLRIDNTILLED